MAEPQQPQRQLSALQKAALWMARKALGGTYSLTDAKLGRFFGGSTYSGKVVDHDTAMQVTAVWGCIRIIAETLGSLPVRMMRRDSNGNAVPADTHPLADVLCGSPNAETTTTEFYEAIGAGLCLQGRAYSLIERNGAKQVAALTPIPGQDVQRVRDQ